MKRFCTRLISSVLACTALLANPEAASAGVSVRESSFVTLGGIEQWITIRGDDAGKPALLVVHGGPGDVLSPHVDAFAPYESEFVVVQWDQRGSGRTYGRHGDRTPQLTLDRVADDGIELAEHLKRRLGKEKLIVLGHSWGSVIAIEMAMRRPDLFGACVGTGQVASWAKSVRAQFDFLDGQAHTTGDETLRAMLAGIQPLDPLNLEDFQQLGGQLRRYLDPADAAWLQRLRTRAKELFTEQELADVSGGMIFSGKSLISTQMRTDLFATAPRLEVPMFVIQGRNDLFTPTAPAIAYFERIQAPLKKLAIIDDAGHFALVTHQTAFLDALLDAVRLLPDTQTGDN